MRDKFENRSLFDNDELKELTQRLDKPAIHRLSLHLLVAASTLGVLIISTPNPIYAIVPMILLGAILSSLFAPFHECVHNTAFKTRQLNTLGAKITGILIGICPTFYREFHFEHHRHTQDPDKDPEISPSPDLLSKWPSNFFWWISRASGIPALLIKVTTTLMLSIIPVAFWDRITPYIPTAKRSRTAWEARTLMLFWGLLAYASIAGFTFMPWIIGAFVISHTFSELWLITEHSGCDNKGSILARTRTTHTHPMVSWFIWNMNYHAEHHAWPAVPWHNLPQLHEKVKSHVEHQADGYLSQHLAVVRRK